MSSQAMRVLLEMGFPENRIEKALSVTKNQGVEEAMEWLLSHGDDLDAQPPTKLNEAASSGDEGFPVIPPPPEERGEGDGQEAEVETGNSDKTESPMEVDPEMEEEEEEEEGNAQEAVAKSIKCDDCGKLFSSSLEVEFHAAKTSHSNFSESTEEKKPLTEEEKKEQIKKLEEKLKERRKEREEIERKKALEKEKCRIKTGKEILSAKKKHEEEEMKRVAEQKRKEKIEERLARQRIKEQIEQDKIARREKFGMGPPAGSSNPLPPTSVKLTSQPQQQSEKKYTHTNIQIRLTNGEALTQSFGSKEQLSSVRLYVEMNRTDEHGPFTLMTNFPKKLFSDEDYEKPLDILGLVPSAVLIVSRSQ